MDSMPFAQSQNVILNSINEGVFTVDPGGGSPADHGNPATLESMQRLLIAEPLRRDHGNRKRAARDLGIDVSTLCRKPKSLNIDPPSTDGCNRTHCCILQYYPSLAAAVSRCP